MDRSEYLAERVDRLVNSRLGKWTLYTTNLARADISEFYDDRVADRLIRDGGEVFETVAQSYAERGRA